MKQATQLQLLAVGYDTAMMEVIERLLNSHADWKGTVAHSKQEGIEKMKKNRYDAVLLCAGVTAADETAFRATVEEEGLTTKIIRHYGGGSGLLENELRAAFNQSGL
ncbi:hypothetical protein QTN47_20995 [Danxiaibacter flavus]|uniref:DUF2325 domain-containing protein n=1 Tax=Danxiaibacter flavus TaxID=3049108 RepID=A0ABV3ZLK9_9BACT|nr:hypothetical protein QNM32_21000 [Chitinophagaceae bacterium DXS]